MATIGRAQPGEKPIRRGEMGEQMSERPAKVDQGHFGSKLLQPPLPGSIRVVKEEEVDTGQWVLVVVCGFFLN